MRRNPARHTRKAIALVVALCIGRTACARNTDARITGELKPLPAELVGSWQVTSVLVDLSTSRTLRYQQNDRRLMGKQFTIDTLALVTDTPEHDSCTRPTVYTWTTSSKLLMSKSFAGHGVPAKAATATDYVLPIDSTNNVHAFWLQCATGSMGPAPLLDARAVPDSIKVGTWVTLLPDKRLAVRWYDQTILLLNRSSLLPLNGS